MLNKQQLITHIIGNPLIRIFAYPILLHKYKNKKVEYQRSEYGAHIRKLKNSKDGGKCFIVGNGPSLTLKDLDVLNRENAICFGMNEIYEIFDKTEWRPDYYFVFDRDSIRINYEKIVNLSIEKIFIEFSRVPKEKILKRNNIYYYLSDYVFSVKRGKAVTDHVCEEVDMLASFVTNVPHLCIEFAIYMGFKEIFLLGIDHDYSFGYGKNHTEGIKEPEYNSKDLYVIADMKVSTQKFQQYKDYADVHDIKIYNSTRGGKLEVFERMSFDDAIHNLRSKI